MYDSTIGQCLEGLAAYYAGDATSQPPPASESLPPPSAMCDAPNIAGYSFGELCSADPGSDSSLVAPAYPVTHRLTADTYALAGVGRSQAYPAGGAVSTTTIPTPVAVTAKGPNPSIDPLTNVATSLSGTFGRAAWSYLNSTVFGGWGGAIANTAVAGMGVLLTAAEHATSAAAQPDEFLIEEHLELLPQSPRPHSAFQNHFAPGGPQLVPGRPGLWRTYLYYGPTDIIRRKGPPEEFLPKSVSPVPVRLWGGSACFSCPPTKPRETGLWPNAARTGWRARRQGAGLVPYLVRLAAVLVGSRLVNVPVANFLAVRRYSPKVEAIGVVLPRL